MAWLITFLAAWGLLCALWVMFGWLLSGSRPVTLVILRPSPGILARLRWLDRMGLLRCRIIAAGDGDAAPLIRADDSTEFCTLAELAARLEAERTHCE